MEHQVEEAERRAKKLHFEKFRTVHTSRFPRELGEKHGLSPSKLIQNSSNLLKNNPENEIDCKALRQNKIYVSAEGDVYPCCFFAADSKQSAYWESFFNRKVERYGKSFNSLHFNDLDLILDSPFYTKDIPESWGVNLENTATCAAHCSKCKI